MWFSFHCTWKHTCTKTWTWLSTLTLLCLASLVLQVFLKHKYPQRCFYLSWIWILICHKGETNFSKICSKSGWERCLDTVTPCRLIVFVRWVDKYVHWSQTVCKLQFYISTWTAPSNSLNISVSFLLTFKVEVTIYLHGNDI